MRTKKVNRYYCDFCKKAGCSGGHISRHEASCTMNPNRVCRMCKMVEHKQVPIADLLAILPDPMMYESETDYGTKRSWCMAGLDPVVNAVLPALREAAGDCPACILAAIRQRGIPVPCVTAFNFTEECKSLWSDINAANAERYWHDS